MGPSRFANPHLKDLTAGPREHEDVPRTDLDPARGRRSDREVPDAVPVHVVEREERAAEAIASSFGNRTEVGHRQRSGRARKGRPGNTGKETARSRGTCCEGRDTEDQGGEERGGEGHRVEDQENGDSGDGRR